MTLTFPVSDRMTDAAAQWAEQRMMDDEEALEVKVEQALLEVEHLVSGDTDVTFQLEDGGETVRFAPSDDLESFLADQAASADIEPGRLLALHVDLFATVFLEDDSERPPNAPPRE